MDKTFLTIMGSVVIAWTLATGSNAKAEFSPEDYIKNYKSSQQYEKESKEEWDRWSKEMEEKRREWERFEESKIITKIDDHSYTVEDLNGHKEYCIANSLNEILVCVDNSLIN